MRKLVSGLLILAMMIMIAACGSNTKNNETVSANTTPKESTGSDTPAKQEELTVWVYDYLVNDNNSPLIKAKEKFEQENPAIKITFQPTVYGTTSYRDKFITQTVGGKGPDVILSDVVWVPQLASMKSILPLGDKAKALQDQFYEGPMKAATYKNEIYGLPWEASPMAIYYNKTAFKEAGLDPENPPKTWDEMHAAAKALTGKGKYGFAYMGGWGGSFDWLPFFWQAGGELFDESGKDALFNSEAGLASANYLFGMVKEKLTPPAALTWKTWDELNSAFGAGLTAMYQSGPWSLQELKSNNLGFEWGVFPSPAGKQQATVLGGTDWVIGKNTQAAEASYKWIEFITNKENMNVLSDINRVSARKDNNEQTIFSDPAMKVFIESIAFAKARPDLTAWSDIDYNVLQPSLMKIVMSNEDIKKTLDEAVKQANEILTKN
ncbi:ABC transporter substrate-binding protein [Paenibacillus nasutitermitis]|uniref:ABC transporter substrate-binding protein n=1 Tax=Paenibacillus nasutitermitis TaxID=1652958 RepID=A0A916Z5V3_9BACL|nr:sugar ABC transporter substrate-binding protein [Paenibacillus nasutitermitis]GGD77922.1 ABC transporter substrate-binding protein [Paenibacillus nasutitermitis]